MQYGAGAGVGEAVLDVFRSVIEGAGGETIRAPFPEYAERPVDFARDKLGVSYLTDEQIEISLSVQENRETNVRAGVSVGKTFVGAILLLWWVYCVGGRVITTAPRDGQVVLIWEEVYNLWHRNQWRLGGECLTHSFKLGNRVRAYGFVAARYAEEGFGGRHDPSLMAIIDEASGMGQIAEDGITANLTDYRNRLLRIGNPLAGGAVFQKACERRSIKVPIWTHPNVSWAYHGSGDLQGVMREEVAARIMDSESGELLLRSDWPEDYQKLADRVPGGPSPEVIEDRRRDRLRGPGTSWWTARHNADFPEDAQNALVPQSWFNAARIRYDESPGQWEGRAKQSTAVFGVDVGDGGDPHAIADRRGPVLKALDLIPTVGDRRDLVRIKAEVERRLTSIPGSVAQFDRIGVGSGPQQELAAKGLAAIPINVGETAIDSEMFANDKAERFWALRLAFQEGAIAIAPLEPAIEDRLREELSAIRYEHTTKGQVRIEAKNKTKKRLGGESYNCADALALTEEIMEAPEPEGWDHVEIHEEGFVL